jgi:L-fuconolactonase
LLRAAIKNDQVACRKDEFAERPPPGLYKGTGEEESLSEATGRIDAHHHLWRYTPEEYGWITDEMSVLRDDFLPGDLKPLLDRAGIDGTVLVQARQTLEETDWLLQQADEAPWIRGVVGWAPISSPEFPDLLAGLREKKKLKSLRHLVQDEPDDGFILNAAFNRGIRAMRDSGLVYDIVIHARHLTHALPFVDNHPHQPFVLDHCAKPRIVKDELEPWAGFIRKLARRPNIVCKISGLVTEADWRQWTPAQIEPYWRVVLEAFGPERLLFGSDWPVELLASEYQRWVDAVAGWTAPLTISEREAIWGGNAARVYSL